MIDIANCGCKNPEMDKLYGEGMRKHNVGEFVIKCLSCGRTYTGLTQKFEEKKE